MLTDLSLFLPYLLHRAAEQTGAEFQRNYKDKYGMLRTEWRVLFHVGHQPGISAKDICDTANLHKTKVSRAVRALELKRFLTRDKREEDLRSEILCLTKTGKAVLADLTQCANDFDRVFEKKLGKDEVIDLKEMLLKLISDE